jgi:hypothetical protein
MSEDITVRVFNEFYNLDLVVNAMEYDTVYAYFSNYTSSDNVAAVFTETLFRISNVTEQSPLDLLQTFQQNPDSMNIALTMAYYLNTISSNKTVLYGVNNLLAPNEAVQRNIVQ